MSGSPSSIDPAVEAAADDLQDVSLADDQHDRQPTRAPAAQGYIPWSNRDDEHEHDDDDGGDGWNQQAHAYPYADGHGLNVDATDSANGFDHNDGSANHRDDDEFRPSTLQDASRPSMNGEPVELEHGSTSPATTPPGSPSLSHSTAPTTVASVSLSSSQDVASSANNQGSVEAGPSSPTETKTPTAAAAAKPTPQKKPSSSRTVMQQVISFTRQRNLPPKNREEEEKHLQQLAEMQAASQEADRRRQAEAAARTAARNATLANAFPDWEKHILPNWRSVFHDDPQGRYLRKLWWNGTMPVRWRGRLWNMSIGNGLALPKTAFVRATERARLLRQDGVLAEVERIAKEDVARTLPALKLFQEGRVMHDDLVELLLAWSVYEKRIPRYAEGLAFPAAMLLLNMPVPEAFTSLVNLIHKSVLRSFYSEDPEDREAYYRVFDTLLADHMPRVYANFMSQVVRPSLYLRPWLSTMYIAFLPLDLATRVFDVFLLEGDSFAFRVALVLLQILEPRLFNPNLDELAAVFAGADKGAVGVVRREKGLLTADGGSLEETDEGVRVEVDHVYTEMGATEEHVFERLNELEWKEETFARLVERELPEA